MSRPAPQLALGSVRDLDAAMQRLRRQLQQQQPAAAGGGGGVNKKASHEQQQRSVPSTPTASPAEHTGNVGDRPGTAELSLQATAILKQIDEFDLFAHVQRKVAATSAPPQSDASRSLGTSESSVGKLITGAGQATRPEDMGVATTVDGGCGSSEPIPADAPLMSDAVMSSSRPHIGVDDHGHPGTVFTLLPGGGGRGGSGRMMIDNWRPLPHFMDALASTRRNLVYFDFLLECIRREQLEEEAGSRTDVGN